MLEKLFKLILTIALLTGVGLFVAGCAAGTGRTAKTYDDNWRFVPRVHVDNDSFGVTSDFEYRGCSYDLTYEGYWCPVNR